MNRNTTHEMVNLHTLTLEHFLRSSDTFQRITASVSIEELESGLNPS